MKMHIKNPPPDILYYLGREQQRRWSDCANTQADPNVFRVWQTGFYDMALIM